GDHICALEVMLGSGEIVRCTPDEEPELFWSTIGGMGLTGLILTVDFCLTAVPSRAIDLETVRVEHLDHFFEASAASSDFTHVVSWVDTVKSGRAMGRGVLMRGRHAQRAQRVSVGAVDRMAGLLGKMVDGKGFHSNALLNRATISMFNEAYFRKEKKGSAHSRVDIIPFFFPLDAVSNWNYVYGPRGFYQYQFVVPERDAVRAALAEVTSSGQYSFLSVIKEFGDRDHGGLSFPTKGVTLAMDFPNTGDDLLGLFERLDAIVVEAGGRVYMGKDARLPAHRMRQMYPEWERWKAVRDQYDPGRVFRSELGLRLELV
ncbi:MAG: D-arabinono-1,4-lactone oxidase, partial [Myxococcota bacterium]